MRRRQSKSNRYGTVFNFFCYFVIYNTDTSNRYVTVFNFFCYFVIYNTDTSNRYGTVFNFFCYFVIYNTDTCLTELCNKHFRDRGQHKTCPDPESFVRGGPFLVAEGWEDQNTTISGPSSACQRNAIYMEFRWRADDGQTLNAVMFQGIWIRIAKKPYIFVIFQGGPDPLPPSGSAHEKDFEYRQTINRP